MLRRTLHLLSGGCVGFGLADLMGASIEWALIGAACWSLVGLGVSMLVEG